MEKFSEFFLNKCLDFSVRIVKLYKYLCEEKKEYIISKQLLRSGTSIGANYAEATNAISSADFIAKCSVSLKEASESNYWLTLLQRTDYLTQDQYKSLKLDLEELIASLTSTLKKKNNKN